MRHAIVTNIPKNPKKILDYALSKSYNNWVDEKGTLDNPGVFQRRPSKLTYEEAFTLIQSSKPHWVFCFREDSKFGDIDHWDLGGCNIGSNDYGEVFIWIHVTVEVFEEIKEKFNLIIKEY